MDSSNLKKRNQCNKRKLRVRSKIHGSAEKPRLCVIKTNAHIHVQLIDDNKGHTIASASTLAKNFRNTEFCCRNKTSAKQVGLEIAKQAKASGINKVVFDRGARKFHGNVAAVADGAREGGLEF